MNKTITAPMGEDKRGISSVIGFTILFSVVLIAVVLGSIAVFSAIDSTQQNEDTNVAENTLKLVQDEIALLHQTKSAEQRAHPFSTSSGQLQTGNETTIRIYRFDGGEPDRVDDLFYEYNTDPIVYRQGNIDIAYVDGAVIRADTDAETSLMVSNPSHTFSTNNILYTSPQLVYEKQPVGGGIDTQMRFVAQDRDVISDIDEQQTEIEIQTEPEYAGAWVQYVESVDILSINTDQTNIEDGIIVYTVDEPKSIEIFTTDIVVE